MKDELLTIPEYAALRGCSKEAVYKRIKSKKNAIHRYLIVDADGKKWLKKEILTDEDIKEPVSKSVCEPVSEPIETTKSNETDANSQQEQTENKPVSDAVSIAVSALEKQLEVKDQQIARLQEELELAHQHERETVDRFTILLKQAQDISLLDKGKGDVIDPVSETVSDPGQETPSAAEQKDIENTQPEKKSFWKRLFGG